ncbi:MAG: 50S ribosomal protein L6 [Candidatus Gottesmanbacteria bacterium]|nr:50S ribosomal protein L6 [Candidatus Gottesmanbacteria bacterium]
MSRIGKMPITLGDGASMNVSGSSVMVKGPKGERVLTIPVGLAVSVSGNQVSVTRLDEERDTRSLHGYFRAELHNAVVGATTLWTKTLELSGVGYRATMNGQSVVLTVGFSHPVTITPPPGITLSVTEGKIIVAGSDKHAVGQVAASVRAVKKPEPYKGKGIKYVGEYVRRKAGKSAKAVGGAPGAK